MALDALKNSGPGERVLLLGNEEIASGVLEAGVSVVSCYPGTPSSEISDTLASLSQDFGFRMEYSANEKAALEVAAGASSYNLT
jgi:indolepyruvate ferredoxin oxidoreductase alpha subunit